MQLPNRWWLVGLDTQFGSELDAPQLRYFTSFLTAKLEPGDSVILCCATPTWVRQPRTRSIATPSTRCTGSSATTSAPGTTTVRRAIEQTGATVRLWITGDSHHYARFAERLAG